MSRTEDPIRRFESVCTLSEEEKQGYFEQAETHFKYVLKVEPSNQGAYLGLAEIYIESDKSDQAIDDFPFRLF